MTDWTPISPGDPSWVPAVVETANTSAAESAAAAAASEAVATAKATAAASSASDAQGYASNAATSETNATAVLATAVKLDGSNTPTANLPMGGFRHTGVGAATARTQYVDVAGLQDGSYTWVDGGGTADAITATYAPAITALVDGQICHVRATAANTTTTPTFSPNGLTAHTIVKTGGAPLSIGDISGDGHELILRYNLANTRWELLNPASVAPEFALSRFATFADADSTAAAASKAVVIDTNVTLSGDLTISAPIIRSDGFAIDVNGHTLTINGIIDAPSKQIFKFTGGGSVLAGASSRQKDADAIWFGAVGDYTGDTGTSTDNSTAISKALAYLASITWTVNSFAFSNLRLYFGRGGYYYDSAAHTFSCLSAECIVDLGEGYRSTVIYTTVDDAWFTFTGTTTEGALCRSRSGIRGGQIIGAKDSGKTAQRAAKFVDVTNAFFDSTTYGFDYGADVELHNKFSFCENFTLSGVCNGNRGLLLSAESHDGVYTPSPSFNNLRHSNYEYNGQDRTVVTGSVGGVIVFSADGFSKKVYNYDGTDGVRFFSGTHGSFFVYAPSPGGSAASTDFNGISGRLAIKPDGLGGIYDGSAAALFFTQTDSHGFGYVDLSCEGVKLGQGNPSDFFVDLSTETNPTSAQTPQWTAIADTRNSGGSTNSNLVNSVQPDVHLPGMCLKFTFTTKASRTATWTHNTGPLQAYSRYMLEIAFSGGAQRHATYLIETRESGISTQVTLIGGGSLPTNWTVAAGSSSGNPSVDTTIDQSADANVGHGIYRLTAMQ